MSTTNIKFRRGNKADLPQSAPSGTPLWCEDKKELYIGTDNGVQKIGNYEFPVIPLVPTSGTIQLVDNSVNRMVAAGNTTFSLPDVTNNGIYHQIIVQINKIYTGNINLGTTMFMDKRKPSTNDSGYYILKYEYDGIRNWVCSGGIYGTENHEGIIDDLEDLLG